MKEKMEQHFGDLILDARDFPDSQFDNLQKPTKYERYKFSSNHILENVLSLNDSEVQ